MTTDPLAELRRDALEGLAAGGLVAAVLIVCAVIYIRAAGGLDDPPPTPSVVAEWEHVERENAP